MERVKGIEPSSQAWEARILPLNHTRFPWRYLCHKQVRNATAEFIRSFPDSPTPSSAGRQKQPGYRRPAEVHKTPRLGAQSPNPKLPLARADSDVHFEKDKAKD